MKSLKIISDLLPIPSYTVILICFFLPFLNIKCSGTDLVSFSGVDLAIGVNMEETMESSEFAKKLNSDLFGDTELNDLSEDYLSDEDSEESEETTPKEEKEKPSILVLAPLIFCIIGLIISFLKIKNKGIYQIILSSISLACLVIFALVMKNSPELQSLNSMGGMNSGLGGGPMISVELGTAYFVVCFFFILLLSFYSFDLYWKKNQQELQNME